MQLYNSLTGKKELFVPARPGEVYLYACGITSYDYCHVGHARSAVVFDLLVRYLRSLGYKVTFIRNFTDVDDKIIAKAAQEGASCDEIAAKYIDAFYEDMDQLGVLRADIEPKATEHIAEMLGLIKDLIAQDKAYATSSGDVYFKVRAFADYGKLSGRSIDEMRSGARVAPGEEKEDPLDFALWKSAKPGEPAWDSPWGKGRPGWHVECSAMSEKYAPLPLDIHGGGQDLIFPHHENEIAQSEAARNKQFARYWVHNGFVQVDSEKMSKSLGNFRTIREILHSYLPETLRFFLVARHYHSPIDFSYDAMEEAEKNLRRFYETLAQVRRECGREKWSNAALSKEFSEEFATLEQAWTKSMDDDVNTAAAVGHMNTMVRLMNRLVEDNNARKTEAAKAVFERFLTVMERWGSILGLFQANPAVFLRDLKNCKAARRHLDISRVEALLQQRQAARQVKDFAASDALRAELAELGVSVRDAPEGVIWDIV